jgi:hypothetical protein
MLAKASKGSEMRDIIDLDRYPINQPGTPAYRELVHNCRAELSRTGMFNLVGFMHPEIARSMAKDHMHRYPAESFRHARAHNIYFKKTVPGLDADHPALKQVETINNTLCSDQLIGTPLERLYEYQPFVDFIADVMEKSALFPMDDKLARFNLMAYFEGEALNWHFDRSEFTITLLMQKPVSGGAFEYRSNLRSADDPNYNGVAQLLSGNDPEMQSMSVEPGTLNVFKGVNTAHRVTPVEGDTARLIAVLTYYETPGRRFTDEENMGFYGRTE